MGAAVGVGKGPRSDINITPLVDVVLVLLIIFMVLTPLMEKEIAVRVPEDVDKNEPVPPPDPNDQQWLVKVDAQGKWLLNGTPYDDAAIIEPLKKAFHDAKAKGDPVIFFDADDKAKYVRAVKALDAIRDSVGGTGWTIGMMTEKLDDQAAAPGTPAPAAPTK